MTPRLRHFVTLVIAVPKQDDQDDEGQHNDEQERDDHRHHDQAGLLVFRGGAVMRTLRRKKGAAESSQLSCNILKCRAHEICVEEAWFDHSPGFQSPLSTLLSNCPLWTQWCWLSGPGGRQCRGRVICGDGVTWRGERPGPISQDGTPHLATSQTQPQGVNYSAHTQTWIRRKGVLVLRMRLHKASQKQNYVPIIVF